MPAHSRFTYAPVTPAQGERPLTGGSRLPPYPLLGQLTEPPLRGSHSLSFTRTPVSHPVLGSSGSLVPLRRIQSPITMATSQGHTHRLFAHFPSDHKGPLGPCAPLLCLGTHSPLAWPFPLSRPLQGHQELPPPGAGCLLSWGGPVVSGGASHTQHSGHTRLSISSLCMGPGWAQGPTACLVLISSWRCWRGSYSVPAARVVGGGRSFTRPSQEHRVLVGRLLQGHGAHLGRYPQGLAPRNRVQSPHFRAPPAHLLVRSDPEPLRAGPEPTNSCSWTGQ